MNIRNLPLLGSLFLSAVVMVGACGSSSSSGTGGTTGSLGGGIGTGTGGTTGAAGGHVGSAGGGTGTGAGGTTVSGSCSSVPSCLQAFTSCLPSGTCMTQMSGSAVSGAFMYNICYSNGVKESTTETFDQTTNAVSLVATISKNGSTCFTETYSDSGAGGASGSGVITIKNAAGTTVATLMDSSDGSGTLVTCPGQAPVLLPDGCNMPTGSMTTTGDCTTGVCQ